MTLAVLGTVWVQLLRAAPMGEVLKHTLLLVLGYYFGARGAKVPPPADALATPADRETNPRDPLYLPRGSIRLLIVIGFAAVAWKLHSESKLLGPAGPPPILVLVGTFIAGGITKALIGFSATLLGARVLTMIGHTLAAVTLAVVFSYCGAIVTRNEALLPEFAEALFLGVVGFYLGKR
jgi:hypothetical protein